ncbi:MAG: putative toxin-antitoxin system toxin component, PIN family [Thiomonas sp.]|jgi:putative PIN family toxin of toxin-antitoxin system
MTSPQHRRICCVLDTQVVLDWVLFDDPRMSHWAQAIQSRSVHWVYSAAMRDEALRVLHYPALRKRHDPAHSTRRLIACFACWGECCAAPHTQRQLVCTDPDDQMFLDLALARQASHLLSRDHAVLRLAPRARPFGLRISPPEAAPVPD